MQKVGQYKKKYANTRKRRPIQKKSAYTKSAPTERTSEPIVRTSQTTDLVCMPTRKAIMESSFLKAWQQIYWYSNVSKVNNDSDTETESVSGPDVTKFT